MAEIRFKHSEALVSMEWLAANLDQPNLRIFDCTTYLELNDGDGAPYTVVSGLTDYATGHIPGAVYLDLQQDFSVAGSRFRFTLPEVANLASAFEQAGADDDTRIILYSRKSPTWATRFWWMLHSLGVDNAALLNGTFEGWAAAGHPVATQPGCYPPGKLTIRPRPGSFTNKAELLAAIGADDTVTINALTPELHRGENARYGRPGRVPGSCNVPAPSLFDAETGVLASPAEAEKAFETAGASPDKRIITYCGGGIFATMDAYVLWQLGHDNIGVYDNSMSEWATDPDLPIETG